jgi:hypothetical protein
MSQNLYQELISKPNRPKFLETFRLIGIRGYVVITSTFSALIIAILSWVIPSPPLKAFFQWLFLIITLIFVVFLIVTTAMYAIQLYKYMSGLENRLSQFRKIILAYSGIDIESITDLKYNLNGIADYRGTVNLLIDLSDRNGLRRGSLLDVVVSTTGEIWGFVEVSRIIDRQAWAFPKDRRNPDFWDSLEGRMKRDPSPPPGIHLEPLLPTEIRQFLFQKGS